MARLDIADRSSIEAAYPHAAFAEDARRNARPEAAVLHGVRLAPASGGVELVRATRHVGEDDAIARKDFVSPFLERSAPAPVAAGEYGGAEAAMGAEPDDRGAYEAFIDRLIEAARALDRSPSPGRGDARLRGLRQ